jgi:L-seryl-tRNA(Ser) seleniumtransferase
MQEHFTKIPSVDSLLRKLSQHLSRMDQKYVKKCIENRINEIKENPKKYKLEQLNRESLSDLISKLVTKQVDSLLNPALKRIINGTGVILHTGLGRAPLGKELLNSFDDISVFTNLEINVHSGKRGERLDHVIPLLQILTGAEDAVITNNNAAATMLCLNSIANRKEVIISRGELVEIGGSFRMPEVMKSSGAKMVEIGATNKTHLKDYEEAINSKTAAIMLVHPSNFEIIGFAQKPEIKEIVQLAKSHDVPVIYDLGSGALVNMENYGFYYEPTVTEMVDLGVELISFSGDKLLGGPQAGIVVGQTKYINKLKNNHLLRALRCDKITIHLLTKILQSFLHEESLPQTNLTYSYFNRNVDNLKKLGKQFSNKIIDSEKFKVSIVESEGRIGSGAYPTYSVISLSLQIDISGLPAEKIARKFRQNDIPILGYIDSEKYFINLLSIHENDIDVLVNTINQI